MKLYLAVTLFLWFAGLTHPAAAALSSAGSLSFGPASLTRDSQQNLLWLTPSATTGLSFLETQALLANDQRFSGFRVATQEELVTLFQQAGIPDINVAGERAFYGTTANVQGVTFLQGLTGLTYSVAVVERLFETAGFLGEPFVSTINGFTVIEIGNVVLRENVATSDGPKSFASAFTTWGAAPVGGKYEGVGMWLVSSIPEPSVLETLAAGLFFLNVKLLRASRTVSVSRCS